MKKRHTPPALSAAALLAALSPLAAQSSLPPAPVRVVEAVRQQIASYVWAPGTVVSRSDARIAAETAGQLIQLAEIGDVVRRGGTIARIDDSALQLQLRNDDATIKRLEANLKFLDQRLERQQRLSEQQIVSANDLEQITSQRETAEQELVAAQVARELTQFQLSRTRVGAPFTGKVVERLQQPGGYVGVGTPLVRLVDVDRVEIRAQAPLSVEPFVREGMDVALRGKGDEGRGTVRTVVRVGDERSRMFEVRIDPAPGDWVIGSPARVALPASHAKEVVAVPRDALVLRSDAVYVFRINGDNTAERIPVETGVGDSALIEIVGDVFAGDRIVVRGAERLRPGQAVEISAGS